MCLLRMQDREGFTQHVREAVMALLRRKGSRYVPVPTEYVLWIANLVVT